MSDALLEKGLRRDADKGDVSAAVQKRCRARAKAMLQKLTPKQRELVTDPAPYVSARCPRRGGKSFAGAAAALITGESHPGSISIIISLDLKQLRRLYWRGGPSGLFVFDREFGLNLQFHDTYLRWEHENGSIGYLMGCANEEQLEVLRGMEADLYLVDECKSFVPSRLDHLIRDIIAPQRSSRRGRVMLIGTPGNNPSGPFYQATCARAVDSKDRPFLVPFGQKDPHGRDVVDDRLWSLHTWTLQDNTAKPWQWKEALLNKAKEGWADDHPTWLREYLGEWAFSEDALVFRYFAERATGHVTWVPQPNDKNPTGLPAVGAPWRLIAGLDIGYEAPTAFVVAAYSRKLGELRHVWDFSGTHLLVHDVARLISEAIERFGPIEKIYADKGNLGKMVVETLVRDYGFPIEAADKREKNDHIELLNGAFARGQVKIVQGTVLEEQLLTNAWDLDSDVDNKNDLARRGRLREDNSIPNDSTDALLYLFRGSQHHFRVADVVAQPEPGTPKWVEQWEKAQLAVARRKPARDARLGDNQFSFAPQGVRRALTRKETIPWR